MIIKNKDVLVRRATEHKELDHVARRNYGKINYSTNGKTEVESWKACAISCLATESTIKGIKKQGGLIDKALKVHEEDGRKFWSVKLSPKLLREMLSDEFNLCDNLIYIAEIIFEGDECRVSNEYSQNWPLMFAQAIPEGVSITNEDVYDFWSECDIDDEDGPVELNVEVEEGPQGYTNIDQYFFHASEDMGDALIEWLESFQAS